MSTEALYRKQKTVLEILGQLGFMRQFYLGGGTALTLYLGHRRSRDFDFFSSERFPTKSILAELRKYGPVTVLLETTDTLTVLFKEVPCSFFEFRYPLLRRTKPGPWHIRLVAFPDIAAMKISSIAGRGSKRDFIDLYFICREAFNLERAIRFFQSKFRDVAYEPYHVLRSLSFFEDAEKDRKPVMLKKVSWDEVKEFFQHEVRMLFEKKQWR